MQLNQINDPLKRTLMLKSGSISCLIILLIINSFCVNGQIRVTEAADYSPIVPRLLSLDHKQKSFHEDQRRIVKEDVLSGYYEENIHIYVEYKRHPNIGQIGFSSTDRIDKLMDFFVVYQYHYFIPFTTIEKLNSHLQTIKIHEYDKLYELDVKNYFIKNDKVKNSKIKKNQYIITDSLNQIQIQFIDEALIMPNSLIEIDMKIKSYFFNEINPSFNILGDFKRNLTFSMPVIFQYSVTGNKENIQLVSDTNTRFQLLNFVRSERDYNKCIEIYDVSSLTSQFKLKSSSDTEILCTFLLLGLRIPTDIDIGVSRKDLYQVK